LREDKCTRVYPETIWVDRVSNRGYKTSCTGGIFMKRTPLYEKHCLLGGKMIDFGGWELPVQYTGILEEHRQVRASAGLFDVSHMGEIHVNGPDSEKYIQNIVRTILSEQRIIR